MARTTKAQTILPLADFARILRARLPRPFFLGLIGFALAGCGPNIYDEVDLMPAPALYASAALDPFVDVTEATLRDRARLFYATDRAPARAADPQAHYSNDRGGVLRTGTSQV